MHAKAVEMQAKIKNQQKENNQTINA
jgi:hypothetical protein